MWQRIPVERIERITEARGETKLLERVVARDELDARDVRPRLERIRERGGVDLARVHFEIYREICDALP